MIFNKNLKYKELSLYPKNEDVIIKEEQIIFIETLQVYFLISKWNMKNISGESLIFMNNDIKDIEENILISAISKELPDLNLLQSISKYKFKKYDNHTFLYYTIK